MSNDGEHGPTEDCRDPVQAMRYVRGALVHLHNFIGLNHAGTKEQILAEYAVNCIDAALDVIEANRKLKEH